MGPRPHFRLFARRVVNLTATLSGQAGGGQRVRLVNIGLGGACVEARGEVTAGARVVLEVATPTLWDPLVLDATVSWVGPGPGETLRAGMRFLPERPPALRALVELLGQERYD